MKPKQLAIPLLFLFCSAVSAGWGYLLERSSQGSIVDFKVVYYGARSLLQGKDPYDEAQITTLYLNDGGRKPANPSEAEQLRQVLALQVYFPTAFLWIAPFAMLPFGWAHLLWGLLTVGAFTGAAWAVWDLAQERAPGATFYLCAFMLVNCGVLFAGGNPAGLSVGLGLIAVWLVFTNRNAWVAVFLLTISLMLKPHDTGLLWLFLLLSGGLCQRRALQALGLTVAFSAVALAWVSAISPHWVSELRSNMTATSVPGGITDPGPVAYNSITPGMITDLQTIFSVFRDHPGFYNPAAMLLGGGLIVVWAGITWRGKPTRPVALLGLAAAAALSMLPVYHRPHDAKLLLLTIPACALLLGEGGVLGWVGLALNSLAIAVTSDLPLAALAMATKDMHLGTETFGAKVQMVLLARPIPLVLLALSIFYLWVYAKRCLLAAGSSAELEPDRQISEARQA